MTTKKLATMAARSLRKNQTEAEEVMWGILRSRRLNGFKFKRQEAIFFEDEFSKESFFIADFYCPRKKLVVELDGGIHEMQKEKENEIKMSAREESQIGTSQR